MLIANPLYDTVFKYMLEDERVAKLFLSALLQREIVELYYNPQEMLHDNEAATEKIPPSEGIEKLTFFSVLRLDFSAKVRDANGKYETILIELQKANNGSDLMRFRKYLGLQYGNKNNAIRSATGKLIAIPLLPIYFLGEGMSTITGHGAVKVERTVRDMFTNEVVSEKDDFIENLSHNAIIVCANELQGEAKTGLEKLLSIFYLAAAVKYEHLLTIDEYAYPEEFRPIIRRLQKAAETPDVRHRMDGEDDLSDYLLGVERERDMERDLKVAALQQIAESQRAVEKAHAEKQAAEANANAMFLTLVRIGIAENLSAEAIAQKYNLSLADVRHAIATT